MVISFLSSRPNIPANAPQSRVRAWFYLKLKKYTGKPINANLIDEAKGWFPW